MATNTPLSACRRGCLLRWRLQCQQATPGHGRCRRHRCPGLRLRLRKRSPPLHAAETLPRPLAASKHPPPAVVQPLLLAQPVTHLRADPHRQRGCAEVGCRLCYPGTCCRVRHLVEHLRPGCCH